MRKESWSEILTPKFPAGPLWNSYLEESGPWHSEWSLPPDQTIASSLLWLSDTSMTKPTISILTASDTCRTESLLTAMMSLILDTTGTLSGLAASHEKLSTSTSPLTCGSEWIDGICTQISSPVRYSDSITPEKLSGMILMTIAQSYSTHGADGPYRLPSPSTRS